MLDCDKFPLDNDMCIASQSDKEPDGEFALLLHCLADNSLKYNKSIGPTTFSIVTLSRILWHILLTIWLTKVSVERRGELSKTCLYSVSLHTTIKMT
jgi:hypothetical protein